jgi:hypothetical protein
MRHASHNRLPRWHRRAIDALTALLLGSGLAWLFVAYQLAPTGEATPAPHPWGGPLLAVHGVCAYLALVGCALVGQVHLRIGWRQPAARAAALTLGMALLVLMATGLGFYYVANEAATPWLRWSHVAAGLLMPVALQWHRIRGRAGRRW